MWRCSTDDGHTKTFWNCFILIVYTWLWVHNWYFSLLFYDCCLLVGYLNNNSRKEKDIWKRVESNSLFFLHFYFKYYWINTRVSNNNNNNVINAINRVSCALSTNTISKTCFRLWLHGNFLVVNLSHLLSPDIVEWCNVSFSSHFIALVRV